MCSDRKIDKYYNFGIIFGPFFSFLPKIVFSANTKQRKKLKLYSLKKKVDHGLQKKVKKRFHHKQSQWRISGASKGDCVGELNWSLSILIVSGLSLENSSTIDSNFASNGRPLIITSIKNIYLTINLI